MRPSNNSLIVKAGHKLLMKEREKVENKSAGERKDKELRGQAGNDNRMREQTPAEKRARAVMMQIS